MIFFLFHIEIEGKGGWIIGGGGDKEYVGPPSEIIGGPGPPAPPPPSSYAYEKDVKSRHPSIHLNYCACVSGTVRGCCVHVRNGKIFYVEYYIKNTVLETASVPVAKFAYFFWAHQNSSKYKLQWHKLSVWQY